MLSITVQNIVEQTFVGVSVEDWSYDIYASINDKKSQIWGIGVYCI